MLLVAECVRRQFAQFLEQCVGVADAAVGIVRKDVERIAAADQFLTLAG